LKMYCFFLDSSQPLGYALLPLAQGQL
jgi:hypothetical protein